MGKTILLADDSVTIRKVVELTFSDTDLRVESVGNGREALERLRVINPDVVLADVVMPEPAGYELCRAIKQSARPVPVLLLAGTFEAFDSRLASECGADDHLIKPFESQVLIDKVERLLSREGPVEQPAPGENWQGGEVDEVLDELASGGSGKAPAARTDLPELPPDAVVAGLARAPALAATEETAPGPEDERSVEGDGPGAGEPRAMRIPLSPEELEAVTRAVIERIGDDVVREVAWEIVPQMAERIVRERLRQLEDEATD